MSRAVRAGNAYIELGLKLRLDKMLKKASRRLQTFGKSVAGLGLGFGAAGVSMLAPLINAGSETEELASKFDAVFGGASDAMKKWSNDFADEIGRSRNLIASFVAGSQDLLVPMGVDESQAKEMSKTLAALTIDLASFNNKSDADVANDLTAAITGSGEVMKKYGVILSETAVNQELANRGFDPKYATEAQKATARLNIILRGTKTAQGDAARTGASFANQLKRMKGIAENIASQLGTKLMPMFASIASVVNNVAQEFAAFMDNNEELVAKILKVVAIGTAAAGVVGGIGLAIMGAGLAIGPLLTGLTAIVGGLFTVVGPVGLVAAGLSALGVMAYRNRDAIMEWGAAIWTVMKPIRTAAMEIFSIFKDTFAGIGGALLSGDIDGAVDVLWAGLKAGFFQGASMVTDTFGVIYNKASEIFGAIAGYVGSAVGSVYSVVAEAFHAVSGVVTGGAAKMAIATLLGMGHIRAIFGSGFDAVLQRVFEFVPTIVGTLSDGFGVLYRNASSTFSGIASAIMGGDISAAVDILWTSIQHAFTTGLGMLQMGWKSATFYMQGLWESMSHAISDTFLKVVGGISGIMNDVLSSIQRSLTALASFDPTGTTAKLAGGIGKASEFATLAQEASLSTRKSQEEQHRKRELIATRNHVNALAAIAARSAKTKAARDAALAKGNAAGDGVTFEGLKKSSATDLEKISAKAGGEDFFASLQDKLAGIFEYQDFALDSGQDAVGGKTTTAGTFSAAGAALLGLGGDTAANETAKNTRDMLAEQKQTNQQLKRNGRGQGQQGPAFAP